MSASCITLSRPDGDDCGMFILKFPFDEGQDASLRDARVFRPELSPR